MKVKTIWLSSAAAGALFIACAVPKPTFAAPIPPAHSYDDLLSPVPDAGARLAADDAAYDAKARFQTVQYMRDDHHHHHHHHHSHQWYRNHGYYWDGSTFELMPNYDHHHHSRRWYSSQGYYWNGWAWARRPNHHHHHHHHHSNY
jgi:hypothetical protein